MPRLTRSDSERAVFLSDFHVPHHDEAAVAVTLSFLTRFRPHRVFLVGDIVDFYQISRFDKRPERLLQLQDDLDRGQALLRRLRVACRQAEILYLGGNHEERLDRLKARHVEISPLRTLTVPSLLELDALHISYRPYSGRAHWCGLVIEHGDRVSKKSGFTGHNMLDARGISGLSGHTHRLGSVYRTDLSGTKVWYENGCLCRLDPEYVHGTPNWQQGFTVAVGNPDVGRCSVTQLPIMDGRLAFEGNLWEVEP